MIALESPTLSDLPTPDASIDVTEPPDVMANSAPPVAPDAPPEMPVVPSKPETDRSEPGAEQPTQDPNELPVEVVTEPGCVRNGETVAATITTAPEVGLVMVGAYSDNDPHGALHFAQTDSAGRYVWLIVVPPTAPPGEANLGVMASSNDGKRTGFGHGRFEVATAEGCADGS
ncbi:MAG: hypothetical protein KY469_15905 [Actinobacteria bacterium]|nr:hypothetical protein [Actinomycetota bacterium]